MELAKQGLQKDFFTRGFLTGVLYHKEPCYTSKQIQNFGSPGCFGSPREHPKSMAKSIRNGRTTWRNLEKPGKT